MSHFLINSQTSYQNSRIAFQSLFAKVVQLTELLLLTVRQVCNAQTVIGKGKGTSNLLWVFLGAEYIRTAYHASRISKYILLEILVKVANSTRKMLALSEHFFRQFLEYIFAQEFVVCHSGIPDSLSILK